MLYAYCVRGADDPAPDPTLRGLEGAEVFPLRGAGAALWLSGVAARPDPTPERIREHDRVVRAALRSATPLPLRFGACFADEASALALLHGRAAEFRAGLERVRGRVEMAVAVGWDAAAGRERLLAERPELRPPAGRPTGGREYLEMRRRELALEEAWRARAEAVLDAVSRRVAGGEPADEERTVLPRSGLAGTLAHLVRREQMFPYRAAVERAAGELPEVELSVSGPWAPYSFV